VWQNLDIARIAASSGLPLVPYIIEQTGEAPDGLVRNWPAPDFGIEQHRSYMVQWYSFALLGCVLWVGLSWRVREPRDD
jgi:cytochrome oxidase assembly protein ShyY1